MLSVANEQIMLLIMVPPNTVIYQCQLSAKSFCELVVLETT